MLRQDARKSKLGYFFDKNAMIISDSESVVEASSKFPSSRFI